MTSNVRVGIFVVTQVYFSNVSYKAFYFHYYDPRKDHSGSIFFYKISATKEKHKKMYFYYGINTSITQNSDVKIRTLNALIHLFAHRSNDQIEMYH